MTPARALSKREREVVLFELHSERFLDASPAAVVATLLDEGRYLASERTMYRVLAAEGEVRERRNQREHPAYQKPELLAQCPNQVWSWDITKLKGPATWTYYYLYAVLDVFSRYIVGWTLQHRESGEVAKALIAQATEQQEITPGTHHPRRPGKLHDLQAGGLPPCGLGRDPDAQPALHLKRQPLLKKRTSRR